MIRIKYSGSRNPTKGYFIYLKQNNENFRVPERLYRAISNTKPKPEKLNLELTRIFHLKKRAFLYIEFADYISNYEVV